MAKNYTFKEAVEIIAKGKNKQAIAELSKRFPILTLRIAKLAALAEEEFIDIAKCMPDNLTANKVNNVIKGMDNEAAEQDEDEDVNEDNYDEDVNEDGDDEEDLDTMTTKELIALCSKRGIKVPKYGKNKQFYISKLNETNDDDHDSDEDDAESTYEDMSIKELYNECKKRKIKVQPKKTKEHYINLLEEFDAAADNDDDDDWNDEEPEERPQKNGKGKKNKKEQEVEDDDDVNDDDDDWDI